MAISGLNGMLFVMIAMSPPPEARASSTVASSSGAGTSVISTVGTALEDLAAAELVMRNYDA